MFIAPAINVERASDGNILCFHNNIFLDIGVEMQNHVAFAKGNEKMSQKGLACSLKIKKLNDGIFCSKATEKKMTLCCSAITILISSIKHSILYIQYTLFNLNKFPQSLPLDSFL